MDRKGLPLPYSLQDETNQTVRRVGNKPLFLFRIIFRLIQTIRQIGEVYATVSITIKQNLTKLSDRIQTFD